MVAAVPIALRAGKAVALVVALVRAGTEQAVLLINRRGAATFILCRDCGESLRCPDCDLPFVFHLAGAVLISRVVGARAGARAGYAAAAAYAPNPAALYSRLQRGLFRCLLARRLVDASHWVAGESEAVVGVAEVGRQARAVGHGTPGILVPPGAAA